MATVAKSDRSTTITLASASAGPFDLTFRLFDEDGLDIYVNDDPVSDWTLTASFADGYDDNAKVTFDSPLAPGDVVIVYSSLNPNRGQDYQDGPGLTAKLNIELARIWSSLSDRKRDADRSVRFFQTVSPTALEAGRAILVNSAGDGIVMGATSDEVANAQGYAIEAKEARDDILSLDADADTLAPGSEATASYDAGTKTLTIGVPRGNIGPAGAPGDGTGDVTGPASATNNNFASFDDVTGKVLKDSGKNAADFATAAQGAKADAAIPNPADGAEGDIAYRNASGVWVNLGAGTAGQALQMNAGATAPEWGDGGLTAASEAEAKAGVENTKYMTALRTRQAMREWDFESGQLSVGTSGTKDIAHGLGAAPRDFSVLVEAVGNTGGMVAGDVADANAIRNTSSSGNVAYAFKADATNVSIIRMGSGTLYGPSAAFNPIYLRWRVRARL